MAKGHKVVSESAKVGALVEVLRVAAGRELRASPLGKAAGVPKSQVFRLLQGEGDRVNIEVRRRFKYYSYKSR